jgi:hypothetical protein
MLLDLVPDLTFEFVAVHILINSVADEGVHGSIVSGDHRESSGTSISVNV